MNKDPEHMYTLLQAMERLENKVLRMNSDPSITIDQVLHSYLAGLEMLFPGMHCAIHRIRNWRLAHGLAPSLPAAYLDTIAGLVIGRNEGSCGAAAATRDRVVVDDISTHPNWAKYTQLAEKYRLRACWSNPILNDSGDTMAVLAMYYYEPRKPTEMDIMIMDKSTAFLQDILLQHPEQTK